MTRRAVFVLPAPARVTPAKLRAELLAAGVPLEPAKPHEPLDCYFSGDRFAVIVDADTDQWDAAVQQVVGAHVPDPLEGPKPRRKRRVREVLQKREEQIVLLVAANRELFDALLQTRTRFNTLRQQLIAGGLPLTVQPLPTQTWDEFKDGILARADADIDAES